MEPRSGDTPRCGHDGRARGLRPAKHRHRRSAEHGPAPGVAPTGVAVPQLRCRRGDGADRAGLAARCYEFIARLGAHGAAPIARSGRSTVVRGQFATRADGARPAIECATAHPHVATATGRPAGRPSCRSSGCGVVVACARDLVLARERPVRGGAELSPRARRGTRQLPRDGAAVVGGDCCHGAPSEGAAPTARAEPRRHVARPVAERERASGCWCCLAWPCRAASWVRCSPSRAARGTRRSSRQHLRGG